MLISVQNIACRAIQFDTLSVDSQTSFTTAVEFNRAMRSEKRSSFLLFRQCFILRDINTSNRYNFHPPSSSLEIDLISFYSTESINDAVNTMRTGENQGDDPAKIVVFYAGPKWGHSHRKSEIKGQYIY